MRAIGAQVDTEEPETTDAAPRDTDNESESEEAETAGATVEVQAAPHIFAGCVE